MGGDRQLGSAGYRLCFRRGRRVHQPCLARWRYRRGCLPLPMPPNSCAMAAQQSEPALHRSEPSCPRSTCSALVNLPGSMPRSATRVLPQEPVFIASKPSSGTMARSRTPPPTPAISLVTYSAPTPPYPREAPPDGGAAAHDQVAFAGSASLLGGAGNRNDPRFLGQQATRGSAGRSVWDCAHAGMLSCGAVQLAL